MLAAPFSRISRNPHFVKIRSPVAAGAKDSGTIVPGMGGVLDVLDSLFFGAPVLYIYIRFFLS